jgi:hypothetical protein
MFGISFEAGELLADEEIDSALDNGGNDMRRGIMRRLIDYDAKYKLKKYSRSKTERAILSLYIFSKELDNSAYRNLQTAVKSYAARKGITANFGKIDGSLRRVDGQLYWNP